MRSQTTLPTRALPALDENRRREVRVRTLTPEQAKRYQPRFDSTRRLRELIGQLPTYHLPDVRNASRESRRTIDSRGANWLRLRQLHSYAVMHKCAIALIALKELCGD